MRKFALLIIAFFGREVIIAQTNYHTIPLPEAISGINEKFSGMTIWKNRLYLLPQYGDHKESGLLGEFKIYSISLDSIRQVVDGKLETLSAFRSISVTQLAGFSTGRASNYEGFEAISIVNGQVFLSMETDDAADSCYILAGSLDTLKQEIVIRPGSTMAIAKYPYIVNAGFEGLCYLPKSKTLVAAYEFNATRKGGVAF